MLLVDMSNVAFGTVVGFHWKTKEQPDLHVTRNLILDRLTTIKRKLYKFSSDEIVLAMDGPDYWRREVFPYYKGKRAAARDADAFDWKTWLPIYNELMDEFREVLPVKVLEVEGAEADDVIAVLAMTYGNARDVCIVSNDKDFMQIQLGCCPKVKQWSPHTGNFMSARAKGYDLFEHIVRGDPDDGIPNILSADDSIVTEGVRQKAIRKTDVEKWRVHGLGAPENFCRDVEMLDRLRRNAQLIDFREIPDWLCDKIREAYENAEVPRGQLFSYFVRHRLTRLLDKGTW